MKTLGILVAGAAVVAMAGAAQAALVNRGGGLIYDTTRDITWLADMNYAQTSMTWAAATAWADNLVYSGFDDWRLPTLNPVDASCTGGFGVGLGYDCTGSELSGLFVTELGYNNDGFGVHITSDDTTEQIANLALFSNVQTGYWSGTDYAPNPDAAYGFSAWGAYQSVGSKDGMLYAVAVRPGDVAAPVSEPQTLALALLALGATAVARRRRPV